MFRHTQPTNDLDRYVADRDARESGFAKLVENTEKNLGGAHESGERALDPGDTRND